LHPPNAGRGGAYGQIIFEFTEAERLDTDHLLNILKTYREIGFKTAIDDFGAGYAGLELLSRFQPDIVKIDMALIRGIDRDPAKQIILKNTLAMLNDLGIAPICEGVETDPELATIRNLGVQLVQGYLLGRPVFAKDPAASYAEDTGQKVPGGSQLA
jgi:EAL domain-containing protein (putative c-di-GMP-specific phosphodiesterase class I)